MPARKKQPPPIPRNGRHVTAVDRVIGIRLKARRLEMHISQDTLGEKVGVSFQQIQKYEKGINRIGAARLQQLARILETDIPYFMGDLVGGKSPTVSKVASFMATADGLAIVEAMIKLESPELRKTVIQLARSLGNA